MKDARSLSFAISPLLSPAAITGMRSTCCGTLVYVLTSEIQADAASSPTRLLPGQDELFNIWQIHSDRFAAVAEASTGFSAGFAFEFRPLFSATDAVASADIS